MAVGEATQVAPGAFSDRAATPARADLPTLSIIRPAIVLLGIAAVLLAAASVVQLFANHSTSSLRYYFFADATIEAMAYGCIAAGLFVSWSFSGRSQVTKDYSFAFMLGVIGAACLTTQWICTFCAYVKEFSTTTLGQSDIANAQQIKHLVDASAFLQFAGWGAIAGAIFMSLVVFTARAKRCLPAI